MLYKRVSCLLGYSTHAAWAGALDQWLKLPAWKISVREFEPYAVLQVSKIQNVSSPLTRKDSILWGAFVTER